MKTIDEHYKDWFGESHLSTSNVPTHDSAEACDFAKYYFDKMNDWISVEDELPEKKDHGFSDQVLAKDKFGNIKIERYDYEFNHFNEIRYDAIETGDGQVTHWIPIELK